LFAKTVGGDSYFNTLGVAQINSEYTLPSSGPERVKFAIPLGIDAYGLKRIVDRSL